MTPRADQQSSRPRAATATPRSPHIPRAAGAVAVPGVSVVIPVLNEARDIGRLLQEVLEQTPPPGGFEVVVADGGSTDRTRDIVRALAPKWPNLTLVDNPGRLSSAGRNVGARASRGRYVVFLDGHCALGRPDHLLRLFELFESTGASCLCRPQPLKKLAEGAWGTAIAAARHSPLGHDPGSDIYGGAPAFTDPRSAGAAYAREVLDELGGYDERFDACEDVEFNHRVAMAGLRAYRHPDLAVEYRPRRSLAAFFRQMRRYGRGRARLMARHPGATPWSLLAATCLAVAWIAVAPLLGWRTSLLVVAVGALLWALVVGVESVRIAGLGRGGYRVAAAFAAVHAGLVLGFWSGLPEARRFRRPRPLQPSTAGDIQ